MLSQSFFLLGARGTGKSTAIRALFKNQSEVLVIDLLDSSLENRLAKNPTLLTSLIESAGPQIKWVVIDEVQKVPKILNLVHKLIEEKKLRFALTGSSARKLKRGGANLLAGRALVHTMHPLTHLELKNEFDLEYTLAFGSLPFIYSLPDKDSIKKFLESYYLTYIQEEIKAEQVLRKLDPFRDFLEIAATNSGKVIELKNLASQVGVDLKTIKTYYQVLEDTYIGFFLPSYHRSIRKAQRVAPKFIWFDCGVQRAVAGMLDLVPHPKTSYYGDLFEIFIIQEIYRALSYKGRLFRLTYLSTHNSGQEVDLIIDQGKGHKTILIEIKSSTSIDEREVKKLALLKKDFPNSSFYYLSQNPYKIVLHGVQCLPWQDFFEQLSKI